MRIWLVVFCGVVAALTRSVAGQDRVVPDSLSLADAVRIAFERNPSFAAVQRDIEIAEADRLVASRRPNPALTVESANYPLFDSLRPSFGNNQELTLRFDQELELVGRRGLRIGAADASIAAAGARVENARRLLRLDVQRAYFQAALARADREVAQTSLEEIDRAIALNRARFDQGEISGGELRRIQVERLKFVDDVFAAELALRNGRSALLALLNVTDLGQVFDLTDQLASAVAPAGDALASLAGSAPLATLAAEAMARRPDVVASQRGGLQAESETRLQRALRTPNVTVGGGYKRDFGTNAIVFGATIPLPLFNHNEGGVARALAVQTQMSLRTRAVENTARLEVQQAANGLAINRERVSYIEREYLKPARESRDIVQASYRAGAANLIDFLDAQRAFRDTVRTYNRALYELRISTFELTAAAALPAQE